AWLVMILAVEQGIDRNRAPIAGKFDEPSSAFLRTVEVAARAEREAVYPVDVPAKLRDRLADMIEPEQPALVHRAEQQFATTAVPDDAAGWSLERPGHQLEAPIRSHKLGLPDRHAGNGQPGAKYAVVRRHIERAPIVVAPCDVAGMPAR